MRKDMFKVIVERPRVGGKYQKGKKNREANRDLETLPKTQGIKKPHRDRKSLNENLKPLQRFFKARVGQKWDNVFAEVCENISVKSTVQKHVRDHVKDLVHLNVKVKDGKVYDRRYFWGGNEHEIWNGDLYVDPASGLLRRYKSENKRYRYRNLSENEKLQHILKPYNLSFEDNTLYKLERTNVKVKANVTHARQDFKSSNVHTLLHSLPASLAHHEYFRTVEELWSDYEAKRQQEKAALQRKKELEDTGDFNGFKR